MPALRDVRREAFCQGVARGHSLHAAYEAAGFSKDPTRSNSSKLSRVRAVADRIAEIRQELDVERRLAVGDGDDLTGMALARHAARLAVSQSNPVALTQAAKAIGQVDGTMTDAVDRDPPSPSRIVENIEAQAGPLAGYCAAVWMGMTADWTTGDGQPAPDRVTPIPEADRLLDSAESVLRRARRNG